MPCYERTSDSNIIAHQGYQEPRAIGGVSANDGPSLAEVLGYDEQRGEAGARAEKCAGAMASERLRRLRSYIIVLEERSSVRRRLFQARKELHLGSNRDVSKLLRLTS